MITSPLKMNVSKCAFDHLQHTQLATHTANFQRLPNAVYADMIASGQSYKTGDVCHAEEMQKVHVATYIFHCVKLVFKAK